MGEGKHADGTGTRCVPVLHEPPLGSVLLIDSFSVASPVINTAVSSRRRGPRDLVSGERRSPGTKRPRKNMSGVIGSNCCAAARSAAAG